jgi:hypothetical protein
LLNIGKGVEIIVVLAFILYGCSYNPDQIHFFQALPTQVPHHPIKKYQLYRKNTQI